MLIKCPECNREISSAAACCPGCGYPINTPPKPKKQSKKKGGGSKLPNGYGSVYKLSGNRRKPWVAAKTFGWILVETADFKNRGIMLQWCLFVERDENYALYNGRGGCHLRFFERAFGAGRCGSVCAETKRRVSARCRNGNAAAG